MKHYVSSREAGRTAAVQEETLTDEKPKHFLTLFYLSFSVRTLWQQRVNVLKTFEI